MSDICKIEIVKGDRDAPTIMKIEFSPMPWNFAFHQGRMEKWVGSEKECQGLEARYAIQKVVYMIEREIVNVAKREGILK